MEVLVESVNDIKKELSSFLHVAKFSLNFCKGRLTARSSYRYNAPYVTGSEL